MTLVPLRPFPEAAMIEALRGKKNVIILERTDEGLSGDNPLAHFPKIKATPRKLPHFLSEEEVRKLLAAPAENTVLGRRDRALLALLYSTGIRASECALCDTELLLVRPVGIDRADRGLIYGFI